MKLKYILPIAAVVLLLFGVVLMALTLTASDEEFVKNITLNDNEVTREKIEFTANGLAPGDTRECVINLTGSTSGNFTFTLEFEEKEVGELKKYIDVTIQYGEDSQTYKLSELLDGKTVSFKYWVDAVDGSAIKLIYSMPIDTGNGAQNATSQFTINLTIKS